jgi:iron complex outermembrane receptor protein
MICPDSGVILLQHFYEKASRTRELPLWSDADLHGWLQDPALIGQSIQERVLHRSIPGREHRGYEKIFGRKTPMKSNSLRAGLAGAVSLGALALAFATPTAFAQQTTAETLRDVITVTATKRPGGTDVQNTPIAVTAFGESQLEALNVRDLTSLSYSVPNVQLEDIGTTRDTANFSIRGLGVNSSIPSIDPTVGLFVDGVYFGVNTGVILDAFDLEAVEVLRGPQGILFGRNVTGGAVLVRTSTPTDEFSWNFRSAIETGFNDADENIVVSGRVIGGISDSWSGKLALYYSNDSGYFRDSVSDNVQGRGETYVIRPALAFRPTDTFESIFRYEYGDVSGDGPISQNHVNGSGIGGLFDRGSFDHAIDEPGFSDGDWHSFTNETNIDVAFGDGQITNIVGLRDYDASFLSDIDATPGFLFHAGGSTGQFQWSNELRYAGTFGNVDVTTGLFYFNQELIAVEQRLILGGAVNLIGGGQIDTETWGVFAQFDWRMNDRLTLTAGGRYSNEDKDARVQTLLPPGVANCTVSIGCASADFVDSDSWSSFAPKLGFQYALDDRSQIYGTWTEGYRSGGYNLRNTSPTATPGPFDQESVSAFELGYKADLLDDRARLNIAVFHNSVDDMQREVNESDPFAGVVQIIRNTADATIQGLEIEGQFSLTDNLLFLGSLGWVDGEYDNVLFDISGDGVVNAVDEGLDIPRLSPLTYTASLIHDAQIGDLGTLTSAIRYSFRDENAYTDSNLGFFEEVGLLDLDFTLNFAGGDADLSFYGRNITDEVTFGNDTQLPSMIGPVPLGGTFSPLNKGRRFGIELRVRG